jgi:hypothetical protein
MKKILLIVVFAISITATAQDDKTITFIVSGQGKTQDEARQVALRSAIEQAFGTFISSKTEILNDNLLKDEIVSVTNGNIQKFESVSEVQLPDGSYAATLKATVSVSRLTTFCESKGVEVEFKGGLFAMNIKLQKLNEDAELQAVQNLLQTCDLLLSKSLDYILNVSEPKINAGENYSVDFSLSIITNDNLKMVNNYFWTSISSIAMSPSDVDDYQKIGKSYGMLVEFNFDCNGDNEIRTEDIIYSKKNGYSNNVVKKKNATVFYLRSINAINAIKKYLIESNKYIYSFSIVANNATLISGNDPQWNLSTTICDDNNCRLLNSFINSFPNSSISKCPGSSNHDYYREARAVGNLDSASKIVYVSGKDKYIGFILKIKKVYSLSEIEKISKFEVTPTSK